MKLPEKIKKLGIFGLVILTAGWLLLPTGDPTDLLLMKFISSWGLLNYLIVAGLMLAVILKVPSIKRLILN